MLALQKFIKENPSNFRELLAEKPYCIKIQENAQLILFKYNQIDSSFDNEIVRECRGIILYINDWSVAFRGFPKFGNYGESYVPEIDWNTASVQEKMDGSFIGIFYNKYTASWQIKTSGMLNAKDAELMDNVFNIKNYHDLVMYTLDKMDMSFGSIVNIIFKDYSIICEVTGPANKIVIPYKDFILTHLSTKHNETGREIEQMIGLPKPKTYPLHSLEDCIASANELPFNEEGYVVVDRMLNRVKIKGLEYLKYHRLKGEDFSIKRFFKLVQLNEQAEFLTYFPEFESVVDSVQEIILNCITYLEKKIEVLESQNLSNRKDYAIFIEEWYFKDYFFKIFTQDIPIQSYVRSLDWKRVPDFLKQPSLTY